MKKLFKKQLTKNQTLPQNHLAPPGKLNLVKMELLMIQSKQLVTLFKIRLKKRLMKKLKNKFNKTKTNQISKLHLLKIKVKRNQTLLVNQLSW